MNRLTYQFANNGHLSFNQKLRAMIFEIFGHETLVDTHDLAVNSHCTGLNIDIYRLARLEWRMLAYRKLFNPFKWLELVLVAPFEMMGWWFQRSPLILGKMSRSIKSWPLKKLEWLHWKICHLILFPLTHVVTNVITGLIKIVLAPTRSVIRPSIDFKFAHPEFTFSYFFLSLLIGTALAASLFTGTLPIVLASVGLTAAAWIVLIKGTAFIQDFRSGLQKMFAGLKDSKHQEVVQFSVPGSTHRITNALHAIDTDQVEVKPLEQQNAAYSLALFLGIEKVFYEKKSPQEAPSSEHVIFFKDLKKYAAAQRKARIETPVEANESPLQLK